VYESVSVLGKPLEPCSLDPETGFYRNGSCDSGDDDFGSHTVCAVMTSEFLEYTRARGNDLTTPNPDLGFPGLKPGDRWCLCAIRWKEARAAGVASPVILEATHAAALDVVPFDELKAHAAGAS
jgi:hypothetical protein